MSKNSQYKSFVDKHSKKLNLDLHYIISNLFWTNLRNTLNLILGFIFNILLIKYLTENDIGLWYWFISLIAQFSIFSISGYRSVGRNLMIERIYSAFSKVTLYRFITTSIGSIGLILFAFYAYYYYNSLWIYFILLAIFIHISYLRYYVDYLYSKDKFQKISTIGIIESVITHVLSIFTLLYTQNLMYVIIMFYGSQVIINFGITVYYLSKVEKSKNLKTDIKLATKFSFSELIPISSQNLDRILLPVFLSLKELAVYGIAAIFPSMLNQISQRLTFSLVFKKSTIYSKKKIKAIYNKYLIYFILAYLIFAIIIYFMIKLLLMYYWKNTNEIILTYSMILLIGTFFSMSTNIFKESIIAQKRIKEFTHNEIIIGLLKIFLVLIVLNFYSLIGLVILKSAMEVIKFILYYLK